MYIYIWVVYIYISCIQQRMCIIVIYIYCQHMPNGQNSSAHGPTIQQSFGTASASLLEATDGTGEVARDLLAARRSVTLLCHGAMVIGPTHPLEKSHDFAVLGMAGNSICTCCGVVEHDDWHPTKYILDRQWSTSIHTLRCHSGPDASLSTQNAVRTAGACCRSVNWPWVVLASFRCCGVKHEMWEMEVSWNGGTPKWMVYSGKAY